MAMMRSLLFWLLTCCSVSVCAQADEIIKPGLLRAQLTLSPSFLFEGKNTHFYMHGNVEGYLSKRISLSGEGYYYLGESVAVKTFDYNHSLFFGTAWHTTKASNDFYVGVQPGLAFTKLNEESSGSNASAGVNPLFSMVGGYNFYMNRILHFFVQTRLVTGKHNYSVPTDLTEIRLSAGLGFNFSPR